MHLTNYNILFAFDNLKIVVIVLQEKNVAVYFTRSLFYPTMCLSVGSGACRFLDVDNPATDAPHPIPVCQRGDDHPTPGASDPQHPDSVRPVRGIRHRQS